jgi:hypothetical protein
MFDTLKEVSEFFLRHPDFWGYSICIGWILIGFIIIKKASTTLNYSMGLDLILFGFSTTLIMCNFELTFGQAGTISFWLILIKPLTFRDTFKDYIFTPRDKYPNNFFSDKDWEEIDKEWEKIDKEAERRMEWPMEWSGDHICSPMCPRIKCSNKSWKVRRRDKGGRA